MNRLVMSKVVVGPRVAWIATAAPGSLLSVGPRTKLVPFFTVVLLTFAVTASAALTSTLTPATRLGARSNEVIFTGSLGNTSATNNLYLNDIRIAFNGGAGSYLTADTNAFFANVPGILSPSQTYTGAIFGVVIGPTAPAGDYFGTVTIVGGTNSSASTDLATNTFQVSSPEVNVVTTSADATELFGDVAVFKVSRIGATNLSLAVNYTISGTASNGTDYNPVANAVTIPVGAFLANVVIVPVVDSLAEGDETVVLTLVGSTNYNVSTSFSASATVHDTPVDAWRFLEFGTNANNAAISGDTADPDFDGTPNLMEYALNMDPLVSDIGGLPTVSIESNCLTLTYTLVIAAADIAYTAEGTGDLPGTWSNDGITESLIADNGATLTIQARDTAHPVSTSTNRFMHLLVTPLAAAPPQ